MMGWFGGLGSGHPRAHGCVIAGAGIALAATTCFGFLVTLDMNTGSSTLGGVANVDIAVVLGLATLVPDLRRCLSRTHSPAKETHS